MRMNTRKIPPVSFKALTILWTPCWNSRDLRSRLFKYGSGTGSNFSRVRAKGELLSGGGESSGVLSFLEGFDRWAGSIKSGGTYQTGSQNGYP